MTGKLQTTLRYASYATVVMVILTLTGIFTGFETRPVIEDFLNLGNVLLLFSLFGMAFFNAMRLEDASFQEKLIHAVVTTIIMGLGLSVVILVQAKVDMTFVFRNLQDLLGSALVFGQSDLASALLLLMAVSVVIGVVAAILVSVPPRIRSQLFISLASITVLGLLQERLIDIIDLPDALTVIIVFVIAYTAIYVLPLPNLSTRLAVGIGIGLAVGLILIALISSVGLERGSWLRGSGTLPRMLSLANVKTIEEAETTVQTTTDNRLPFMLIIGAIGAIGALVATAESRMHNSAWYLISGLLLIGILNWQDTMNLGIALLSLTLLMAMFTVIPYLSNKANERFQLLGKSTAQPTAPLPSRIQDTGEQKITRLLLYAASLGVMLITPIFAGQYITSVLDLVMLYIIMGIGLNVMIGYAGLLDLGYVASYAIGAYTAGILTTPSVVTLGCVAPAAADYDYFVMCRGILTHWGGTGVLTFWETVPLAILFSALTGMMLGVPVLRLRGDYLAIVTLGFGEIVNRLLLSNTFKPLVGGAQGISPIPSPVINLSRLNPDWVYTLGDAKDNYYLFLAGAFFAAFVVYRLASSRLGRAWLAIRADEDVAEAIGIHLVGTKLLAFGISSAFAGLGGAIFGGWLQGIFPNSFTLFVSINVLSLIIIGGMGSIPGVVLGAFILIGLPEALREIQDYRLLAFGSLLVVAMLLKPEGLLPPEPPKLSEKARPKQKLKETA